MNLFVAYYWFSLIPFAFITQDATSKIIYKFFYKQITIKGKRKICHRIDVQYIFYDDDVYDNNCTMISKITPIKAILLTKISVILTCAWPPSPNATKFDVILFKVLWYMCYLSSILLLLPLLSSVYEYRDDPVILAKSVCLSCAVLQVTLKMMVCRIQYNRFQVCI